MHRQFYLSEFCDELPGVDVCTTLPKTITHAILLDIDNTISDLPAQQLCGLDIDGHFQKLYPGVGPKHPRFAKLWLQALTHLLPKRFRSSQALAGLQFILETILRNGGVPGIVITSAWRTNLTVAELREVFTPCSFGKYIVGRTSGVGGEDRPPQVKEWIQLHPHIPYVVLDDRDFGGGLRKVCEHRFIRVDPNVLLTLKQAILACEILGLKFLPPRITKRTPLVIAIFAVIIMVTVIISILTLRFRA